MMALPCFWSVGRKVLGLGHERLFGLFERTWPKRQYYPNTCAPLMLTTESSSWPAGCFWTGMLMMLKLEPKAFDSVIHSLCQSFSSNSFISNHEMTKSDILNQCQNMVQKQPGFQNAQVPHHVHPSHDVCKTKTICIIHLVRLKAVDTLHSVLAHSPIGSLLSPWTLFTLFEFHHTFRGCELCL